MDDATLGLTKIIVASFAANRDVAAGELPDLILSVQRALAQAVSGAATPDAEPEPKAPATTVRKSVTPDYLVCLEDGKRYKTLKRHLRVSHGFDPVAYRAKWGLKPDYPMVAPNYAVARSTLAKAIGLGQGRKAAAPPAPEPASAPVKRTRRPKAPKPDAAAV